MTRKKLVVISGGTIGLILLTILLVNFVNKQEAGAPEIVTGTVNDLFPSGESRPDFVIDPNLATSTPDNNDGESRSSDFATSDRSGRFFQVSTQPIGGLVRLGTGTSSPLVLVEKATGHLYRVADGTRNLERISNTTIPKIYHLTGGQTGTSTQIIFQYLKDGRVQTFSGQLDLESTASGDIFLNQHGELEPLASTFLTTDISELNIAPKQDKMFWMETGGGEVSGYIANNLVGDKRELLFRSPYPEWRIAWATSTTLTLQTRASQTVTGSLYFVDTKTKKWTPVITGVPGLTTLVSPNLDRVVYSGTIGRGLVFGLYDVKKNLFGRLNLQTWADKCVWNRTGTIVYCAVPSVLPIEHQYPDDWYRGETNLADNIWKIDSQTNQAEIIFSPAIANLGVAIDGDNLTLASDETKLYLTNRHDGRLWALNLETGF